MLERYFLAHPRSVGESYGQHFRTAAGFGVSLLGASAAAFVHALLPNLFERTASTTVKRLYGDMKSRQPSFAAEPPAYQAPEWQIEYEI